MMKIIWDIADICNLDCKYCGAKEYLQEKKALLKYEEFQTIISNFSGDVSEVDLLGGEPFLLPRFEDIILLLAGNGISINIITNGQIDLLEKLKHIKEIKKISVSIDGDENVMNEHRGYETYEKAKNFVMKAIEMKKEDGINWDIGINAVLSTLNYKRIQQFMDEWIGWRIDYISITPLICEGNAKENPWIILKSNELLDAYEEITEYIKSNRYERKIFLDVSNPYLAEYLNAKYNTLFPIEKKKCEAAEKVIYMDSYGNISSCRMNKSLVGDLKKESLKECYSSFNSFLMMKEKANYNRECDCIYSRECKICCLDTSMNKLEICTQIDKRYNVSEMLYSKFFLLNKAACFFCDPEKKLYVIEYLNYDKVYYTNEGFEILMAIDDCSRTADEIADMINMESEVIFRFLIQEYSKRHVELIEV